MTRHGRSNHLNMLVQPGLRPSNFGDPEQIGVVPYVSRARLIMLYVQSEALRTSGREVGLGRSMNQRLRWPRVGCNAQRGK